MSARSFANPRIDRPLVEIAFCPQPSSALKFQDGDHTFREEVLSVRQKYACTASYGSVCESFRQCQE